MLDSFSRHMPDISILANVNYHFYRGQSCFRDNDKSITKGHGITTHLLYILFLKFKLELPLNIFGGKKTDLNG